MLTIPSDYRIYISNQLTDMRKSINGLSSLVEEVFAKNLQSRNIFIFFGKKKDKIKILFWNKNGYVVYYKKLCKMKFKYSKDRDKPEVITSEQLSWLLAGLDYKTMDLFSELDYSNYY